jgi:hypothetical protein
MPRVPKKRRAAPPRRGRDRIEAVSRVRINGVRVPALMAEAGLTLAPSMTFRIGRSWL